MEQAWTPPLTDGPLTDNSKLFDAPTDVTARPRTGKGPLNATRVVVLSAGLFLAGSASTCVVVDYSPSVTVEGAVRSSTGEAIALSVVRVQSSVSRYRPDTAIVGATGEYSIEVREGLGPKVLDAGIAVVICGPPSGLALLPDTVVLERFILRADRAVVRRADCVLAP